MGSPNSEKKSKLMKWLGKFFKGGSGRNSTSEQHPQFLGDENMVWRAPTRSLVQFVILVFGVIGVCIYNFCYMNYQWPNSAAYVLMLIG